MVGVKAWRCRSTSGEPAVGTTANFEALGSGL